MQRKNGKFSALFLTILFLFQLSASVYAADTVVSPALNIIANDLGLVKACLEDEAVVFSAHDFDNAVGVNRLDSITIVSIPPVTEGRLTLNGNDVMANQTISRSALSSLRFEPAPGSSGASFVFRAGGTYKYDLTCTLYVLENINYAPTVAALSTGVTSLVTIKNITAYGAMKASDPENDTLTYRITSYPKKGILKVYDRSVGSYSYTPTANYTGKDSFTYEVYDKYGNVSNSVTVSITVKKSSSGTFYDDMVGHWAHNAAVKLADAGIMEGETVGNKKIFDPDSAVTRCEFLVMAMNCTGYKINTAVSDTGFVDDKDISEKYKGYVSAAHELGFINGSAEADGLYFLPNYQITRAEAAVILTNILGAKQSVIKPVFADRSAIPAWAEKAVFAMSELGVIKGSENGMISPNSGITRAQAAQMLSTALELK